jgi:hypothetical protein
VNEVVILARYGLLMSGQPLEEGTPEGAKFKKGYFWGTLFEGRQTSPLPIGKGVYHYPVALLRPAKAKIRCEICFQPVEDIQRFWQNLFETEMYYPQQSPENSLMHMAHTNVFTHEGEEFFIPVFVLNPLFYVFWKNKYNMELIEIMPNGKGFVSWHDVPSWSPNDFQ